MSLILCLATAPLVAPYNLQLNATQTAISILWSCTVAEHTEIFYNITVLKMDGDTMVIQTQEAELSFIHLQNYAQTTHSQWLPGVCLMLVILQSQ